MLANPDMNSIVGERNILFITLDALRYDVAQSLWNCGGLANWRRFLPSSGWEKRHTPANFTYAAHHAFFSGFLPTPVDNPKHSRLFACEFPGSETCSSDTYVFTEPTIVQGLANRGYKTHCIGGVGFFNGKTSLGSVLPSLFQESYWNVELGVTCKESSQHQVQLATKIVKENHNRQRLFLFVNVSAIHQPNYFYLENAQQDCFDSQMAALDYVDRSFASLFDLPELKDGWFVILCSDHGTALGESGLYGHRLNHAVVGDVPYAHFLLG